MQPPRRQEMCNFKRRNTCICNLTIFDWPWWNCCQSRPWFRKIEQQSFWTCLTKKRNLDDTRNVSSSHSIRWWVIQLQNFEEDQYCLPAKTVVEDKQFLSSCSRYLIARRIKTLLMKHQFLRISILSKLSVTLIPNLVLKSSNLLPEHL